MYELNVLDRVKLGHDDQSVPSRESMKNIHQQTEQMIQRQHGHGDVIAGHGSEVDVIGVTAK